MKSIVLVALAIAGLAACTGHASGKGHTGSATSGGSARFNHPAGSQAPAPIAVFPIVDYVDISGSPRLATSTDPTTRQSTWSVVVVPGSELVGTTTLPAPAADGTISVNTTLTVHAVPGGTSSTLTVSGWLRPQSLTAHLTLQADQPPIQAVLDTGTPDVDAAKSRVTALVQALDSSDWAAVAGMLAPDVTQGAPSSSIADTFAAAGLTNIKVTLAGAGRLVRLNSGNPGWLQAYSATARTTAGASRTLKGTMVFVDESQQWWLLSTTT